MTDIESAEDQMYRLAKQRLSQAIHDYYSVIQPEMFLDGWVLVVHKQSAELAKTGQSAVSFLSETGQAFHETIGMLTVALDSSRGSDRR